MSRTKAAVFIVLLLSLNGLIFFPGASAQNSDDGTSDSATDDSLSESQTGLFDLEGNVQLDSTPIFLSAPLLGIEDHRFLLNKSETVKDTPNKDLKAQLFGPINMRRVIPIILENPIDSKSIKIGDLVKAKLKENLYYGTYLLAPANSLINGHITSYRNSRTLNQATWQSEDRFKSDAAIEIQFDNLLTDNNCLPLVGHLVHQESVRQTPDGSFYGITVDRNGKIVEGGRTLSKNQKDIYNALRIGTSVPLPASLLVNAAAGPIIMGTVGGIYPDVAFNKPLDPSMSHKRFKGMAYGFVTNLPGAFFVQAVIEKGNEITLSNGDELMIDITISDQINSQLANKPSISSVNEDLVVEGKVLDEKINTNSLPLKPYITETSLDKSTSAKINQEAQILQENLSDTTSIAANVQAKKELE